MLHRRTIEKSIERAQAIVPSFGRHIITTSDCDRLLRAAGVFSTVEELPQKYAALMVPACGGRLLVIGRHVRRSARHVVLLHEAGHRMQRTDSFAVTYSSEDWTSPAEAGADVFAAIGLFPTQLVDDILNEVIFVRQAEEDVARELAFQSAGMWTEERALWVARNRLRIRETIDL